MSDISGLLCICCASWLGCGDVNRDNKGYEKSAGERLGEGTCL